MAHIQAFMGPIDPSGTIVFADIENGPRQGERWVVIGDVGNSQDERQLVVIWCVDPPWLGVTPEAGRSLSPLNDRDVGVFYGGDFDGLAYNLASFCPSLPARDGT